MLSWQVCSQVCNQHCLSSAGLQHQWLSETGAEDEAAGVGAGVAPHHRPMGQQLDLQARPPVACIPTGVAEAEAWAMARSTAESAWRDEIVVQLAVAERISRVAASVAACVARSVTVSIDILVVVVAVVVVVVLPGPGTAVLPFDAPSEVPATGSEEDEEEEEEEEEAEEEVVPAAPAAVEEPAPAPATTAALALPTPLSTPST